MAFFRRKDLVLCFICSNFSAYTSYLELVCAVNGLLGAWWGNFRQQSLVDRIAEEGDHEILLEIGSDAERRVTALFDKREGVDKHTRQAGWICAAVIVVLTLASLLLIEPSATVPTWMKILLIVLPFCLPSIIVYAFFRNWRLRRSIDEVILTDLKERMRAEGALPSIRRPHDSA